MTKGQHKIFLIIILFYSCTHLRKIKNQDSNYIVEEIQIVNLVYNEIIEPDTTWIRNAKSWNEYNTYNQYEFDSIKFDSLKVAEEIIRNNKLFDTTTIYVYLYDSLIRFSRSDIDLAILTDENYSLNFSADTNFRKLIFKLTDSTKSIKFDSRLIKSNYKYKITKYLNWNSNEVITCNVGHIKISRVAFNLDKTKACIYAELVKGELNGFGCLLFLEKKNNTWKIISKKQLWVS